MRQFFTSDEAFDVWAFVARPVEHIALSFALLLS